VTDEQRRPLPGATVEWDEDALNSETAMRVLVEATQGNIGELARWTLSPKSVVTDLDGRYTLRGRRGSNRSVTTSAHDYEPQTRTVPRAERADFTLRRRAGGHARGRVVDEAGHPLTRFSIDGSVFTPDDGRFELEHAGGSAQLSLTSPGFTTRRVKAVFDRPEQNLGDLVMTRGHPLQVVVTAESHPVDGVKVTASQPEQSLSCLTAADGRCVIDALGEAQVKVRAEKAGYLPAATVVEASALGQPVPLSLTVATGQLHGQVFVRPGQPARGRTVSLVGAAQRELLTDADGRFSADGLAGGFGCVSLRDRREFPTWAAPVDISATPSPVHLGPVSGGATLTGTRLLPGLLILVQASSAVSSVSDVVPADVCLATKGLVVATFFTGSFRVEGLPPGRWSTFLISGDTFRSTTSPPPVVIDLLANETKTLP
ncbi:MAG: carboxypeptidase regulatory-like domain-containing protein, partial [Archangium sp.]|nr:carboxypeptidase regulatory-like domain-containing protein [Archangium sp.]